MSTLKNEILSFGGVRRGITFGWSKWFAPALICLGLGIGSVHAATVTTLVPSGMTVPLNGFIAEGSLINPGNGLKYRHLWIPDHLNGLCRVDPHLDSPTGTVYSLNLNTCAALPSGSTVYDPQLQFIYIADEVANKANQGLVRRSFNPNGDGGHGLIGTTATTLGGGGSCGIAGNRPTSLALGPDGNLYLTFFKSGNIMRVKGPNSASVPCGNFASVATSGRRNFALAWVGHNLYGLGDASPWRIINADQCATPTNPSSCGSEDVFTDAALIPGGISSNQLGKSSAGNVLYIADINAITKIDDPNGAAVVTTNWATGMSNPSSVTFDTRGPAVNNPDIYVADDPTGGNGQLQGRVFKVSANADPFPPLAPTAVHADPTGNGAIVSWAPGSSGSTPTISYTVNIFDSTGLTQVLPPQTTALASPAPTSLAVAGLINGNTYTFTVAANSAAGSSAPSALSNAVTPQAPIAPSAPQNLSVITGGNIAAVSWAAPSSNGGSPIISYSLRYHASGIGSPIFIDNIPGNLTATLVGGLLPTTEYEFSVIAINVAGESDPSNIFLATTATGPAPKLDVALSMTATDVLSGADSVITMLVTNTGGVSVPQVRLDAVLPSTGFDRATIPTTTTLGVCLPEDPLTHTLICNLGQMNPGQSATVTITLKNVTAQITTNATVRDFQVEVGGVTELVDENPVDNIGSVTTHILPPPPEPQPVTDLQINSGSASNATLNNVLTYSFGIKNGNAVANDVVFTLPLPSQFSFSGASVNGTPCSTAMVSGVLTVNCNIGQLAAGAQRSISVAVIPTLRGTFAVTGFANFAGFNSDPKPSNNTRTISVTVK
ncbi:fibronectin type III domain-containing protein [Nitrosomonas supralitoralis]|uniref:Fibronectin type-III domain-containing protein n=1 Tax=Nitrosomonas supralitoralis TaxID=2116706 RepID=A0A2P7NYN8_9PROT|nr:fibronectin type III domain-containing protein [Nitrosomonas supralitoralis]PSJ18559.1 hypothetical protein C7H79_01820 [Nitrosomonas supralitoralis]